MRVVGRRARERRSKVPFDARAGAAGGFLALELRRYDGQGWRAMFFPSGFEHSLTSHAGAGWASSPWAAVQQAASGAINKLQAAEPPNWTSIDDSPR
jgi:hypothetical protein